MPKKILVLGGYGRIGGGLLRRLQNEPDIECVLGGRDATRGAREAASLGVDFVPVDVTRAASVNAALDGVFAAVHAAGPFQWRDYAVASACVRRHVHYLDFANTRSFIVGISTLDDRARGNGVCVLSGAGMTPALSGALVAELAPAFDRIDAIDISLCTGVAGGPAAARALFAEAGRPIRRLEAGKWRDVRVGTAAAEIVFSPPFGRRRLFCQDAADLELFPKRFGAETVRYQASYAPGLMRTVQMISWLRSWGLLAEPERLASSPRQPLRASVPGMGLRVCLQGERHEALVRREIELLSPSDDTLLPCAPVLALLRRWQRGETIAPGARPCMDVPSFTDIKSVLVGSGVLLSIV
ncbi:MAG: saccharopine dehydrogenase family protein [Acidiferrobacteraceae bacterium]